MKWNHKKMLFKVNYRYHLKIWWDLWVYKSQSQKVILNIAELKKLYINLIKRIKEQKKKIIEIKLFKIDKRVYL